ncbi:hypothetical protein AAFC00_007051 [Neodothiora populina]|uniref:DUF1776-domain-containing protein n=1 Tax=Neodothiora populina TaxID=2781224 RepID=A0ABR3PC36_9PEZI
MTDAQHFFDVARQQYNELADGIERHFEHVATQLKDWIPQQTKQTPPPPPPPPRRLLPASYWQSVQRWVSRNTAMSAGIAAFVGTGAVLLFIQRQAHYKKRRARRSSGGARTEVVVISGSPSSPLTLALALDLERRGFIVYFVTSSAEDEQHIRGQSRVDLLPLNLDLVHPSTAQEQVSRFRNFLSRHHHAFHGAPAHALSLAGIIIVPETTATAEPIYATSPEAWSTALNAKILSTIMTTQSLLPLATEFKSRILFLTPSIVPSLRLPYHSVQSTVSGALDGFTATLAAELASANIPVCNFRLGNIGTPGGKHRKDDNRLIRGSSMRKVHDSVFDALHAKRPSRTWYVGRGSMVYDLIGAWMPSALVNRMMGVNTMIAPVADDVSTQDSEEDHGTRSIEWEKV